MSAQSPDYDALHEAAAWLAEVGYPVDFYYSVPLPQALWDALVDHIHADATGNWHGNTLDREETEAWLADEAGRLLPPASTDGGAA